MEKILIFQEKCLNSECKNGYVKIKLQRKGGYEESSGNCSSCSGRGHIFSVIEGPPKLKGFIDVSRIDQLRKDYEVQIVDKTN